MKIIYNEGIATFRPETTLELSALIGLYHEMKGAPTAAARAAKMARPVGMAAPAKKATYRRQCPECQLKFKGARGVAKHRNAAHLAKQEPQYGRTEATPALN